MNAQDTTHIQYMYFKVLKVGLRHHGGSQYVPRCTQWMQIRTLEEGTWCNIRRIIKMPRNQHSSGFSIKRSADGLPKATKPAKPLQQCTSSFQFFHACKALIYGRALSESYGRTRVWTYCRDPQIIVGISTSNQFESETSMSVQGRFLELRPTF